MKPHVKSNVKAQKRLSYSILALFYLMGGIEYAVILPTLWLYISRRFDAEQYFLGIIMSAFSLAALISSPFFGRLVDRFRKPKLFLMLSTLWQIGGSFMYFMGISKWFLLGSRLICGLGAGGESLILAEIARVTSEEERTGIISTMISMRQMGLLLGPGLNLFLRMSNFYIGPFIVDKYSSPGAFMACVWTLQCLLILFLYTDLHKLKELEVNISKSSHQNCDTSKDTQQNNSIDSDQQHDSSMREQYDDVNWSNQNTDQQYDARNSEYGSISGSCDEQHLQVNADDQPKKIEKLTLKLLYHEYVREETVAIFGIQFNSFFNQIALETMVTPLTDKLMHWGELENSLLYCFAGVEVIGVFILVRFLSRRFSDRAMMLFGCLILTIANCWLIYVIPSSSPDTPKQNIAKLSLGIVLDMLSLPFLIVCSVSLYTKITKKDMQGLSQGIRRSIVGIAAILAPLWAGSTLHWPYLMFGVMIGLLAISLVMMLLSYSKLRTEKSTSKNENTQTSDGEKEPLLSGK